MKRVATSKILDKLHRGFVYTCMGLTLYGTAIIGHRVYRYFSVVKPQREIAEMKMLEDPNFDASSLVDKAPKIRS